MVRLIKLIENSPLLKPFEGVQIHGWYDIYPVYVHKCRFVRSLHLTALLVELIRFHYEVGFIGLIKLCDKK